MARIEGVLLERARGVALCVLPERMAQAPAAVFFRASR